MKRYWQPSLGSFTFFSKRSRTETDTKLSTSIRDKISKRIKMFPVGTKIISCEFSSERNYTAELRSKCKSKEEFKLWLTDFQNITGTSYCVLSTIPRTGQRVLYKAAYRCHRNTYSSSHRAVKAPSKKHTGCAAQLRVTVKAFVEGCKSRSQDTLMADYPTIIRIRYNHNHDIDVPEVEKFKDLEENVDPSWLSLLLQKKDQGNPDAGDKNYCEEMESDDEESDWEEMESMMKKITAIFKEKFEESPKDFANALSSMHRSIRTMKTATLLSAMHNFGKTQYKTITARKATSIPVQQTVVSQKNTLLARVDS